MKKYNGKLTISRVSSSRGEDYVQIALTDETSGTRVAEAK